MVIKFVNVDVIRNFMKVVLMECWVLKLDNDGVVVGLFLVEER